MGGGGALKKKGSAFEKIFKIKDRKYNKNFIKINL